MLILLPPSETKLDGGDESAVLDLAALSYQALSGPRRSALKATMSLSRNLKTMSEALGLGPTQHFELLRNRAIRVAPVMPALERYTGVLYDALDVATLPEAARAFAGSTVVIHSALFGLLGADDPIPAYRLSHDSRLPEIRMRSLWSQTISAELARHDGLILDLRSEAYVALGPVPPDANAFYLRVLSQGADGQKRALNHFNKKGKGAFVRALLEAGQDHADVESLLAWAHDSGMNLKQGPAGDLHFTVDATLAPSR
ncbi:MAG: peroxide stress protein YaaA [Microbacteriaceae bacterium]|jgi:cytoplasmic iron level regulating protein YaaA (DUF328/UPF0246 family)|nr:peroxide stress protein YaaA [Microbacteriaceae bacterium]